LLRVHAIAVLIQSLGAHVIAELNHSHWALLLLLCEITVIRHSCYRIIKSQLLRAHVIAVLNHNHCSCYRGVNSQSIVAHGKPEPMAHAVSLC
jgi:hypothetical protein